MFLLKQTQWFPYRIFSLLINYSCVFKTQLHNLKKVSVNVNGKLSFYNNFHTVMRTKSSSKVKKRSLKKIKLQKIMASLTNRKSNETILKAESSKKVPIEQASAGNRFATASNCKPSTCCKKEEETASTRRKESIKSFDSNNDKKHNDSNKSKQSPVVTNTVRYQEYSISNNILIPSLNGSINWRLHNNAWSASLNESRLTQNITVAPPPIVYRTFSDSRLQQQHLNLAYLNNAGSTINHYNKYHMHRSDTPDTTNITAAAERDKQQAWALRSWQHTSYGKKILKRSIRSLSSTFTVMSYNVLAQELLTEHSYLYRRHQPKALLWEQRWFNLLSEIRQHNADILCLQEVQASHLESYYSELKKQGYDVLYKQRTGIRTDGCAIFFKNSLFNLVEYTTVEFNQSNIPVLNRDNVAIVAKFSCKQNPGNEFVVATTHLLYNPRREDVRLAQTQVLLTEVDRISFKKEGLNHTHVPIIITGDFNLKPHSAVYELITRGMLEYENLTNRTLSRYSANATHANITGKSLLPSFLRITDKCQHADLVDRRKENAIINREDELKIIQLQHTERNLNAKCAKNMNKSWFSTGILSHHLALKSAYEHRYGDSVEATTFQEEWVTVDYIFYSGVRDEHDLIRDGKLKLLARYTIPTREQLRGVRIPNFAFGSDHLSLITKFQLDP